ncbi:hypothetical protein ABZ770_42340 [Streptomyces sp. NPDC006654]|uniref:hypothetical protein n=1 Tax=Streptomyces sp. NPDC006654 TaxID=3156897 RepID=UPI0033C94891
MIDADAHAPLSGAPVAQSVDLTGPASGYHTLALPTAFRDRPGPADDETSLRAPTRAGGLRIGHRTADGFLRTRCCTVAGRTAVPARRIRSAHAVTGDRTSNRTRRAPRASQAVALRTTSPLSAQVARCAHAPEEAAFTEKPGRADPQARFRQPGRDEVVGDVLATGPARPLHSEGHP